MDTVVLQMPAIAAIERAIPGVTHAYDQPPDTIEGNLPAFVNIPNTSTDTWGLSSTEDQEGNEVFETNEARNWTAGLYVAQRGEGIEGEIARRCIPFFDSVRDALQGHQSLGGVPGVLKVNFQGDSGFMFERLKYQNLIYSGIIFRFQVISRITVAIAPGE